MVSFEGFLLMQYKCIFCLQTVKDMLQPLRTPETLGIQPVTKLMELCQKNKLKIKLVDNWEKIREIEMHITKLSKICVRKLVLMKCKGEF